MARGPPRRTCRGGRGRARRLELIIEEAVHDDQPCVIQTLSGRAVGGLRPEGVAAVEVSDGSGVWSAATIANDACAEAWRTEAPPSRLGRPVFCAGCGYSDGAAYGVWNP